MNKSDQIPAKVESAILFDLSMTAPLRQSWTNSVFLCDLSILWLQFNFESTLNNSESCLTWIL